MQENNEQFEPHPNTQETWQGEHTSPTQSLLDQRHRTDLDSPSPKPYHHRRAPPTVVSRNDLDDTNSPSPTIFVTKPHSNKGQTLVSLDPIPVALNQYVLPPLASPPRKVLLKSN
jgi:hypothetical protein